MNRATCKTCGGLAPNHIPSIFDRDGIGNPAHRIVDDPSGPTKVSLDQDKLIRLRYSSDPIEAFNLFIELFLPSLYSHFIDSDDNEGEFVRQTIQRQREVDRLDAKIEALTKAQRADFIRIHVNEQIEDLKARRARLVGERDGND